VDEALQRDEISKQLWHTLVFEQWLQARDREPTQMATQSADGMLT
jgi:hypothetical protein